MIRIAAFFAARDAALQPYEDVEATIEALVERGVTLVAATNGNSAMVQAPIFRRMHLLWTAEEARVSKPNPAFFLGAMERSGAKQGNRGWNAAETAIEMANVAKQL